ncbi:MAG: pyridoxal-phosphate dependent enzyme [Desulfurococcales archaeon]|nr:pyridoxal-phosphate dependent enzyme [Desulfurococcales archaeon]
MSIIGMVCPRCGFSSTDKYYPFCPRCGSPLELRGELGLKDNIMGEGNTPLVEVRRHGSPVYFKLEYLNPTGSFKDRGSSISLLLAKELGYRCVVEDSSGNTGLSVAAYSARLGLKAWIVVPAGAAESKKALIKMTGAELLEEPDRGKAASKARALMGECFYVSHATSPVFIEGVSSLGEEILSDAGPGIPIILPVSSGTLLLGVYRAFRRRGVKPHIIAVQSSEHASLRGKVRLLAEIGGDRSRLADALVYRDPPRLDEMAEAARDGGLVVVGDDAIKRSLMDLYSMGFIVEPSSAVVWAAYRELSERGLIDEALLILTGSGLKYAGLLQDIVKPVK